MAITSPLCTVKLTPLSTSAGMPPPLKQPPPSTYGIRQNMCYSKTKDLSNELEWKIFCTHILATNLTYFNNRIIIFNFFFVKIIINKICLAFITTLPLWCGKCCAPLVRNRFRSFSCHSFSRYTVLLLGGDVTHTRERNTKMCTSLFVSVLLTLFVCCAHKYTLTPSNT